MSLSRWRRTMFSAAVVAVALSSLALLWEVRLRRLAGLERPWVVQPHQSEADRVIEGRVRSLRPGLSWVQAPSSVPLEGATVNNWGYHDEDFVLPKPPGTLRVVVVGDSMTYGPEVAVDRTWPAQLEGLLAGTMNSKTRVEVLNLALPGYQVMQVLATVRSVVLEHLEPDVVIYAAYSNDLEDTELHHYWFNMSFEAACGSPEDHDVMHPSMMLWPARLEVALRSRSLALGDLRHRLAVLRYGSVFPWLDQTFDAYEPHLEVCRRFRFSYAAIAALHGLLDERSVPFLLTHVPNAEHLLSPAPSSFEEFLDSVAEMHPELDYLPVRTEMGEGARTRGLETPSLHLSADDLHLSEVGHALFAETLAPHLLHRLCGGVLGSWCSSASVESGAGDVTLGEAREGRGEYGE